MSQSEARKPIIAAGGVVYRRNQNGEVELLLIKKRDGFWTLPKGRVEPGESVEQAATREVAEETGISGTIQALVQEISYAIRKNGRERAKSVTYYLLAADSADPRPAHKEGIQKARWFEIGEALRRIRRERVREIAAIGRELIIGKAET